MKPPFSELVAIVLDPLAGRPESDWQRAPAGKWTPAQIVEHLAIGMNFSADKFAARRAHGPMARRGRTALEWLAHLLILDVQWYPQGFKAPEGSRPADGVSGAKAEDHFRAGLSKWAELERRLLPTRRTDLFVKHPRLGDLTLEEWMRFHVIHACHHARQIRARLAG